MSRSLRRASLFTLLSALLAVAVPSEAQWGRATVRGMVFDESDTQGVAGATVELTGDRSSERLREVHLVATTDEKGRYLLERVPYGRYEFRVRAPGFTTYEIPLYVASDALTELHVQLVREARPD